MRCIELTSIKLKFKKEPKVNGENIFPLNQRPQLREAIERVLATGKEEIVNQSGSCIIFHIRPEFPLIESAMQDPRNREFLKVYINIYTQVLSLGVKA